MNVLYLILIFILVGECLFQLGRWVQRRIQRKEEQKKMWDTLKNTQTPEERADEKYARQWAAWKP